MYYNVSLVFFSFLWCTLERYRRKILPTFIFVHSRERTCGENVPVRADIAHKNIPLKSRWKIRTSLWLRRPRAMESISTCSNKLHAKFASRSAAVYRANGLNFSIWNISRANYSNYKFLTHEPRHVFGHVCDIVHLSDAATMEKQIKSTTPKTRFKKLFSKNRMDARANIIREKNVIPIEIPLQLREWRVQFPQTKLL